MVFASKLNPHDEAVVTAQLGRAPRGAVAVAWRCPCGNPGVVVTAPRLPDGTPFPTMYYLTCSKAIRACSVMEGDHVMAEMTQSLHDDHDLAEYYARAHRAYLDDRVRLGEQLGIEVPEIAEVSCGGMPDRVKCLHALAAHSLAKGPGVNPIGDEVVARLGEFWQPGCVGFLACSRGEEGCS